MLSSTLVFWSPPGLSKSSCAQLRRPLMLQNDTATTFCGLIGSVTLGVISSGIVFVFLEDIPWHTCHICRNNYSERGIHLQ